MLITHIHTHKMYLILYLLNTLINTASKYKNDHPLFCKFYCENMITKIFELSIYLFIFEVPQSFP